MVLLLVGWNDAPRCERTFFGDFQLDHWRNSSRAAEAEPPVGTKVAKAVCNEPVFVQFYRPGDVGAVAEYNVRSGINHAVGKFPHIASVFTVKGFRTFGNMLMDGAFCSAVKRNDDHVSFFFQLCHNLFCPGNIAHIASAAVGGKSAKAIFYPIALEDHGFIRARQPCVVDTDFFQRRFGALAALRPKIAGVVVGQAQYVKSGIYIMVHIAFRRPENIADLGIPTGFRRPSFVQNRAFLISECDIGGFQNFAHIIQQVFAIVGRQVTG